MKYFVGFAFASLLSACSTAPSISTSYGGADAFSPDPTSSKDVRLHHRAFYGDNESTPTWMKAAPRNNE